MNQMFATCPLTQHQPHLASSEFGCTRNNFILFYSLGPVHLVHPMISLVVDIKLNETELFFCAISFLVDDNNNHIFKAKLSFNFYT